MTIIKNTGFNSSANIFVLQFANRLPPASANTRPSIANTALSDRFNPDSTFTSLLGKWSDAKQAIDKLNQVTQDMKPSRKAIAAAMVQRIKEQIKLLMTMIGGDPTAKARQIAQLARELSAAAREYAAAAGGNSQAGAAASAGSSSDQTNDAESSSNLPGDADSKTSDTAKIASDSSAAQKENAERTATTSPANPAGSTSPTQQASEHNRSKALEYSQNANSADAKSDQEFVKEVKKLATLLKALAKQNEANARKESAQSTDREMQITNAALNEIERSLSSINSVDAAAAVSISIVAN